MFFGDKNLTLARCACLGLFKEKYGLRRGTERKGTNRTWKLIHTDKQHLRSHKVRVHREREGERERESGSEKVH